MNRFSEKNGYRQMDGGMDRFTGAPPKGFKNIFIHA